MTYRLFPGWRAGDEWLLPALRTVYSYTDQWPNRATGYLYSEGHEGMLAPAPWPDVLAILGPQLLDALEATTGTRFTVAAFQAYRDGTGCGWHHDRNWGAQAILSLGVTRTFAIRSGDGIEARWLLQHGDLFYMPPGFQDEWEHCVPTENVPGERCSLVFRTA